MKILLLFWVFSISQIVFPKGATPPEDPFRLNKPISIPIATVYQEYNYLPKPPSGYDWKLWFSDEFNGTTLDKKKWQHSCENCKRRLGYWRNDAAGVDGKGNLLIKAFKDGDKYISGAIETIPQIKFKYGFYIAKVKTQKNKKMWSAFWLWPHNAGANGAVELDIFEYGFTPFVGQNALHWYQGQHRQSIKLFWHDFPNEWHTFAVYYTPNEITFYRDGKVTWKLRSEPTDSPLMIMFSTEIGEWAWGQKLNLDLLPEGIVDYTKIEKLPDEWHVDWVRFYTITPKK